MNEPPALTLRAMFARILSNRACAIACAFLTCAAATVPANAEIFINEVDADTPGTDAAEFVELYNSGTEAVSLTGYALVFYNGSNDTSYLTTSLNGQTIPANGYFVIGNTVVTNVSSVTFAGNILQNGQDAVALYSGVADAASFPNTTAVASPPAGAVLVDAVVYDTNDADDTGLIDALTPGQPQIDEAGGGASDARSIARVPDGGTLRNTSTYVAQTPTPGASNGVGGTPVLTLAITPGTFVENGSTGTVTGTITRTGSTTAALTVTLTSANPAEATVPATVEIAIGQTQQTFTVTAMDELVSDGNKTFNITAEAPGFTAVTRSITVQDNEPVLTPLTVELTEASLPEGASTAGTVTRPNNPPLTALTVTLTSSNPSKAAPDVTTVNIAADELFANFNVTAVEDAVYSPTSAVTITASAAGFANGTDTVTVNDNDSPPSFGPPTVVVNKFSNTTPELIELLVIGNGTPGTTLDMRRMVVKDFSSNMNSDGGQAFRFKDTTFFSAIKVGTLIVLSNGGTSTDVTQTAADDFNLTLALNDTTYFDAQPGTTAMDLATTEMVMIKQADADFAGVAGSIHALATGTAGTQFNLTPVSKLISTTTSPANTGVVALSNTSSLADYDGTDATGGVALSIANFGNPNDLATGGPNTIYIRSLRGITNLNGTGSVTSLANSTVGSPYLGVNIFPRNATEQTVTLNFTGVSSGTLSGIKITIPEAFGTSLAAADVVASGPGAGTPVVSVSGQPAAPKTVTITGLALTAANSVTVSIAGRVTPNPLAPTDLPSYPFLVETSELGTLYSAIGQQPTAAVLVPISVLRDVDASGVALDFGKTVAIEGVCTEAQFSNNPTSTGNNGTSDTAAFLQDGDFGLGIYIPGTSLNLTRGNRYAVSGTLGQFSGLSQITLPRGVTNTVIDRGAATEPSPLVITLADLFATPESYEGRLIKVLNLSYTSGTWGPSQTLTLKDATPTNLSVRIQAGSGVNTGPTSTSNFPVNITGIVSQFDGSNPFTTGYQLQPRENSDIEAGAAPTAYETWAAGFTGIGGPNADADGDGQSNFLEFALGTLPNDSASRQQPNLAPIGSEPGFALLKGSAATASTSYVLEGSTDLTSWIPATIDGSEFKIFENDSTTISGQYLGNSPRVFWRLRVALLAP